jgi:hypothetical protein
VLLKMAWFPIDDFHDISLVYRQPALQSVFAI